MEILISLIVGYILGLATYFFVSKKLLLSKGEIKQFEDAIQKTIDDLKASVKQNV